MPMYAIKQPGEVVRGLYGAEPRRLPGSLRKTVGQGATILETFQALAYQREEQLRVSADLLEREIWAVSRVLLASEPIWDQNPSLTLSFPLNQPNEPVVYRLELSRFSRLKELLSPTPEEQELIGSTEPRWARVAPHLERHLAGHSDELACSYRPISMAEAVKLLGLDRIVDQVEAAARTAQVTVMHEARTLEDRGARLQAIEQMFGWEAEPKVKPPVPIQTQLAMALLGSGDLAFLPLGLIGAGVTAGAIGVFLSLTWALIAFVIGVTLLAARGWYVIHAVRGG
jgi:hypothetical protein